MIAEGLLRSIGISNFYPATFEALGHQSVETTKHYLAKFSSTKMAKVTDIDLSY